MPDIFLSYSRDDQATARRFAEGFEREGFSVWWDQTLHSGENYDQVTEGALREAKAVVVLWSKKSVDSRWVRAEATTADRAGTLIPAMIEPCNRPIMFELKHTAELAHWKGEPNDPAWKAFVADVHRFVRKGEPSVQASVVAPGARNSRISAKTMWLLVAAVLLAGAAVWAITHLGSKPAPVAESAAVSTSSVAASVTLAVLPFANLSSDPEQEYFSDGLTEEILNQLAQVKALRVTGRTSSFSFKGKNEDLRIIGQKLGVANLLEGSVRKDGTNLRITAQLISGKDGAHLWSQTYDREMSKVFAVQEEIAKDVAQALSITLDVGDMNRAQGGTTNVEAYDKYLRARQLTMLDTADATNQAVNLFREAVKMDPAFSRAWLELSGALQVQQIFRPKAAKALQPEIDEALERVKRLAPDAWWTHLLVAKGLLEERKWAEADAAIHAGLAATAGRELPLELVAEYFDVMWRTGRLEEALLVSDRALAQDPLALSLARTVQAMLDCAGRAEEAQVQYERTRVQVGSSGAIEYWTLARMLMRDDASTAAIRAQMRVVAQKGNRPLALNTWLAEHFTDRVSALPQVRKAFDDPSNQGIVAMWAIAMYADRFGDKDLALAALRKWVVEDKGPSNILWWQFKTGLRSDPRFKQIVTDAGLTDYWRTSGKWGDYCKAVGPEDFECH
jgi:TolB-like protein